MNITKKEKTTFFKKYGYLLAVSFLLIAVASIFIVAKYGSATPLKVDQKDPIEDVNTSPIVFSSPLAKLEIIKDFSATALKYNKTLKQWEAHKAIDFKAQEGEDVFAVYGGKVVSVTSEYLTGNTIVIEHLGGIRTVYGSLGDNVGVAVGDTVKVGQKIGTASTSAKAEYQEGAHLHFEVLKDGKKINPADYLILSEK